MKTRIAIWVVVEALVVLTARTIVYALSPSPFALHFEHAAGGPRLPFVAIGALTLAVAASSAILWLAALGVRERQLLLDEPLVRAPRLGLRRFAVSAVLLFGVGCTAFALVESTIHWRAGLGWHGIHCLVGPVHRDAIPVIAALSLVAAALGAALEHVLAWMRRTVARLRTRGPALRPAPRRHPAGLVLPCCETTGSRVRSRGPPAVVV